jgi:hypothetical protein
MKDFFSSDMSLRDTDTFEQTAQSSTDVWNCKMHTSRELPNAGRSQVFIEQQPHQSPVMDPNVGCNVRTTEAADIRFLKAVMGHTRRNINGMMK